MALNGAEAAQKSWFAVAVEIGLRRSKPQWKWMIGGHLSMATGVGERAEQPEGLYLGCEPRYSRQKMGSGWSSWSMMGRKKIITSGHSMMWCVQMQTDAVVRASTLASSLVDFKKRPRLFPPWSSLLIRIWIFYSETKDVWIVILKLNKSNVFLI
jgi:hypothetical protein